MPLLEAPISAERQVQSQGAIRWVLLPIALLSAWVVIVLLACIPIVVNMINTPQQEHTLESAQRIGSVTWAAMFATPFDLGPAHVTLLPWGFTLVVIGTFWWAGRLIALACDRRSPLIGSILLLSAVLTGVASALIGRTAALGDVIFQETQVGAFGFAMAVIGLGLGWLTAARTQLPPVVRAILRGSGVAVGTLLAIGALLILISFLRNVTTAQELLDALQPTAGTGLLITGLQIGYLPVLIVWAISYLTGAGFLLGTQTVISPFIATAAPVDVPPLPLLAAVPTSASPVAWLFPVSIVLVGALAGHAAIRRLDGPRWIGFVAAFGMAVVAAGIVTMMTVMSTGALGVERLASIGPAPEIVGLIIGGLLLLGALPRAVLSARV